LHARILKHLGDHALATTALVLSLLALAGSSYAAFTISGSQIRNHTIDPVKLNPRLISGNVRAWALVTSSGRVIAGGGGPSVSLVGSGYTINWRVKLGHRCATLASVDGRTSPPTEVVAGARMTAGFAVASSSSAHGISSSSIQTYNQQGQPIQLGFDAAVVC
jgi:hypothetical protein